MIRLTNILTEDEYVDQAYVMGDTPQDNPIDDYDELDVEQEDMDDFISYLKSYSNELTEANCPCVFEAEYQGREVKLGKPSQGDVKKFPKSFVSTLPLYSATCVQVFISIT